MSMDLDFDQKHLWHPYTSTITPDRCYPVTHAQGVRLTFEDGQEVIDAMGSWWSTIHGYNHPELNQALIDQTHKMAHVMFGGLTHEPAIELGKKLVHLTPEPLEKVFLADSGSIAVEVALKMAIQYWASQNKPNKSRFVTVRNGYHGDSFGAMSVCDPVKGMHSLFKHVLPQSLFLEAIPLGYETPIDSQLLNRFEHQIALHQDSLAAFIIEPIVQNTGGIRIYNPQWLNAIEHLCQKYNLLLIFDEIATGFGRTGKMFALEHADVCPDILCLGKALSAGYLTLAATLTSKRVADTICQGNPGVFMHGPTFMGNPLACAVANQSIALLQSQQSLVRIQEIESLSLSYREALLAIETVNDVRILGAIIAVEMVADVNVHQVQSFFINHGVWIRPFGRMIYAMPPYTIEDQDLITILDTLKAYATHIAGLYHP